VPVKVADELRAHLRPIDDLVPLPNNPRQGDIGAISESLLRFGQQKPIVVDSEGVILAGNHTYHAAVALGWTEIAAVESNLNGADRPAFALADNRIADLATYDQMALAELLDELYDDGGLIGTGFDGDDLDTLVADLAAEMAQPEHKNQFGSADFLTGRISFRFGDHSGTIPRDVYDRFVVGFNTARQNGTELLEDYLAEVFGGVDE
jgi:hypothetical protein